MSTFQKIKLATKSAVCCIIRAGKRIASAIVKFPGKIIQRIKDVIQSFKQTRLREQILKEGGIVPNEPKRMTRAQFNLSRDFSGRRPSFASSVNSDILDI